MVIGLIFFLTFLEIPEKNKDLITSIIGMLVGSISMAISIFVGRDPDDVKSLKDKIDELNSDRNALIERLRDAQIDKDVLRRQLEELQSQVIDRLSIFVGQYNLTRVGKPEKLSEEQERWMPKERKHSRVITQAPHVPETKTPHSGPVAMEPPVFTPAPSGNEFDNWLDDMIPKDKE